MRGAKILAWIFAVLIGLPAVLLLLLLLFGNIDPGRKLIARLVPSLTGGSVVVADLAGRFPDRLRIGHAELRDSDGSYATLDNLSIDWSPLRLLTGDVAVQRLAAERVSLLRLPVSGQSQSSGGLPLGLDVTRLEIGSLQLAPELAGVPAALGVTGALHVASLEDARFLLDASVDGEAARYHLEGKIDPAGLALHVKAEEPAGGPLARLAGMPDLGALAVNADVAGPRNAEVVTVTATAGALQAQGQGTIDLADRKLDLDVTADAPAMAPAPTLSWRQAALDAHVHGSFTAPEVQGRFALSGLAAAEAKAEDVSLDVSGSAGRITFSGSVAGVTLPGPEPSLLAVAPVALAGDMTLDDPVRPLHLTITHPLLSATARIETAPAINGTLTLALSDLEPLAALGGVALAGTGTVAAAVSHDQAGTAIAADGTVSITGGMPQAVAMIGTDGRFSLAARLAGSEIALDSLTVEGGRARMSASGSGSNGSAALDWQLAIDDVAPLVPDVSGSVAASGHAEGAMDDLAVTAEADAELATRGFARSPLHLSLTAHGLPGAPQGSITAEGSLDRSPVTMALGIERDSGGTLRLAIDRAEWRSLRASGTAMLPPGLPVPIGSANLHVGTLADLAPFLGQKASGSLDAVLDIAERGPQQQARIRVSGTNLALGGSAARTLQLDGTIDDPLGRPVAALKLAADGVVSGGISGRIALDANGPETALALRLTGDLRQQGKPMTVSGAAQANVARKDLQLTSLVATYEGETARLLGPARIQFADGVTVDRLRLGIQRAVIELTGRVSPRLDMSASVRNVDLALAKPFLPGVAAQGTVTADAKLTGSVADADGVVHLTATGLRVNSGAGRAMPPADIQATAVVKGGTARLDVRLSAGNRARLAISGDAPLDPARPLALRASGNLDLLLFDPILAANGRHVQGQLMLTAAIAGTLAEPRITGTAALSKGELQDYAQGVHITDIAADLQADGQTLRIQRFVGRAGQGTISLAGMVGMLAPGLPLQITVDAQNARPLASDLVTATLSGQLKLTGQAAGEMSLAGRIRVARAEITIPDSFPPQVAKLPVRIPGQKPAPSTRATLPLALDLVIDAPQQVFVRGHGLDAEMGGSLTIRGSSAAPQILGGLDMRHGSFSLAGQNLDFTSGRVSFEGSSLSRKIDPSLNFVAQSSSAGVTATLTITGFADQPKIALTSSPELPQDEILAHLLFGQSVKQLGPLQLAQIAEALVSLGGGSGANPLAAVRKGLGLDRLSVGSNASGSGGTVEAGRYVANGVFVGAKQNTAGGTQAEVQIDLSKHFKLQTTVGSGGTPVTGATPQNDPGSSVGLTYQFEY